MAEVTKKKIATIYSLIAGFFLSLFSGHLHAGEFLRSSSVTPQRTAITPKNTTPTTYTVKTVPNTISAGANFMPAPTNSATPNTLSAGANFTPAPTALDGAKTESLNIQFIEDNDARDFIMNKAELNGLDSSNLSRDFVNTTMIEYLTKEVESLKAQIQAK